MKTFLEQKGVQPQVAPGEAHTRLGIVERRHMVLRTAVENYLDNAAVEKTIDTVREAVNHVAPVMNNLSFTRGYTPSQWVLNSNPRDPTALTSDEFNPSIHHDALTNPDFEAEMQRRTAAKLAFMKSGCRLSSASCFTSSPPIVTSSVGRRPKVFLLAGRRRTACRKIVGEVRLSC